MRMENKKMNKIQEEIKKQSKRIFDNELKELKDQPKNNNLALIQARQKFIAKAIDSISKVLIEKKIVTEHELNVHLLKELIKKK